MILLLAAAIAVSNLHDPHIEQAKPFDGNGEMPGRALSFSIASVNTTATRVSITSWWDDLGFQRTR